MSAHGRSRGTCPTIEVSRSGVISSTNQFFAALMGYAPEALVGMTLVELSRAHFTGWEVGCEADEPRELRLVAADGSERVLVAWPSSIGSNGELLLACHDITPHCAAAAAALNREQTARNDAQRYAEMLQAASDWYWETDAELRYTYFSPNTEVLAGRPPSAFLGKRRDEFAEVQLNPAQWSEHVATLRARRPFRDFVYRTKRSDGDALWVKASGVPIFGPDNAFVGYRGIASNVTAQIEAERAVRESETRLRQLFAVATDWFWETDAAGRFTFLSSRWGAVTGQDPNQYIGRKREEFGDRTSDPDAWRQHVAAVRARKPFRDFTYRLVSREGSTCWVKTSGIPVFHEDTGEFRGYRGVGSDITETTLQEQELRRREAEARVARQRAEQADRAKSDFLAAMSHELRTPLNAVIGFAEMIELAQLGPVPERYREYGALVRKGGQHLLAIINDILDFAKVEAGKTEIYPEPVELPAIMEDVIRLVAGQAKTGKLTLQHELESMLPRIQADPIRLRQILLNLLSNAIKFTPEGGTVSVLAAECAEGVRINVIDTGIGMAEEDIPKALEPFCQLANRQRNREGTGLGLPLTKALVELHGGRLELTSALAVGTRVSIMFPALVNGANSDYPPSLRVTG